MISPRSSLLPVLSLFVLAGAVVGCAPQASDVARARDARPAESRAPSTAEAVYRSYIDASNAIDLSDPDTFDPPSALTTRRYHADQVILWASMREKGYTVEGKIAVESFRASPPAADGSVAATACTDVSTVTLLDRGGESLLPADRPDAYTMHLQFALVGDELRLDRSVGVAAERCTPDASLPTPGTPTPGALGERAKEQVGRCATSPGDPTICEG